MPADKRQIGALDRMIGKLSGKPLVRRVVLGDDQQPGGILVDAVDNAGPRHPANMPVSSGPQ